MIISKDISVVVQGVVHPEFTSTCLNSVRKHLPEAELILSTWCGSDLKGFDFDVLVETDDPGGFKDGLAPNFTNNLHRQAISTRNGLKKAIRPYALKIRGDVALQSANFLTFWDNNPQRMDDYALFDHKIICSDYFFKKTVGRKEIMPVPFHIGDWVQFGLVQDMLRLWDITLPQEPDFTLYFASKSSLSVKKNLAGTYNQFAPEQYQLITACRMNKINVPMEDCMDYNSKNIEIYEKVVTNNFIIISPHKWAFLPLKEPYHTWYKRNRLPWDLAASLYTEEVLNADYNKYILKE